MSTTDWIISTSAGAIAILITLVAYFAQKWFESIDEKLKEHSGDIKDLSKQIGTLEQKQNYQAENITKTIHTELAAVKFPRFKIDQIEQEVSLVRHTVQEKLLPQSERLQENYGKILVLEGTVREQNEKLFKMFSALKILVEKQKNQTKASDLKSGEG